MSEKDNTAKLEKIMQASIKSTTTISDVCAMLLESCRAKGLTAQEAGGTIISGLANALWITVQFLMPAADTEKTINKIFREFGKAKRLSNALSEDGCACYTEEVPEPMKEEIKKDVEEEISKLFNKFKPDINSAAKA